MLRWTRLLIVLVLAASPVAALPSFPISEPAYAPSQARFVVGSEEGFVALDRGYMTRLTKDGAIVDPAPKYLFPGTALTARSVTSGAGLVVGSCGPVGFGDACGRTEAVTVEGRPSWTVDGVGGTVVFDGTNFVVVSGGAASFRLTFIDRSGAVLRVIDMPLQSCCGIFIFDVVPIDDGLIISWISRKEITPYSGSYVLTAVRIDSAGRAGSPIVLDSAVDGFALAMASSGDEALIVWNRAPNGIAAARLDSHGIVQPSVALTESDDAVALALVWDGARYRLAWQVKSNNVNHVFVADVDPDPLAIDGAAVEYGAGESTHPRIAISGNQLLLAYDAGDFGATFARFLSASDRVSALATSAPKSVFTRTQRELSPAITWTGDRYLVVWVRPDLRGTLVGRELRADGTPLGPTVPIATVSPNEVRAVGVASVGEFSLIVWTEAFHVRALRVGRGLTALTEPVTLGEGYGADVATSGSDFALAWLDPASSGVYGRIIEADRPLAFEMPTPIPTIPQPHDVRVAWGGDSYVLMVKHDYSYSCDMFSCGATDTYVADFVRGGSLGPMQRVARNVLSGDEGLVSAPTGLVYFWCGGHGCGASFVTGDFASGGINLAPSSFGEVRDVVWTGESFLVIGSHNTFRFSVAGANGQMLSPPFKTPGSSFPVAAPRALVAASSGDGRAMMVFIPNDVTLGVQAAIVGVPSRRRSSGSGE